MNVHRLTAIGDETFCAAGPDCPTCNYDADDAPLIRAENRALLWRLNPAAADAAFGSRCPMALRMERAA